MDSEAIDLNIRDEEMLEQELVISAKNGDDMALEYLIAKYKGFIYNKAKAYYLIGSDKEDIIQEGLIGLYKAIRDYKEDKAVSFRAFADICITRQIITAVKAATRQKHIPLNSYISLNRSIYEDDAERQLMDVFLIEPQQDPEEMVIGQDSVKRLQSKIKKTLSALELKVFRSYLQGRSYEEIALHLDKGVKSVDNAMQRIKRKLEKCMDADMIWNVRRQGKGVPRSR